MRIRRCFRAKRNGKDRLERFVARKVPNRSTAADSCKAAIRNAVAEADSCPIKIAASTSLYP